MKIAILCAGLDQVLRGYESHSRILFEALKPIAASEGWQLKLFKRIGERKADETVLPTPFRNDWICQAFSTIRRSHLYWESVFFSFVFLLRAFFLREKWDRLLVIEPMVAKVLTRFSRCLPGNPIIIFTHGEMLSPEHYQEMGHVIQQVNLENYEQMESFWKQYPELRRPHHLIPHFIPDLHSSKGNATLKKQLGIQTPKLLLSVGSVEGVQKRMDYIIREAAGLDSDWTLAICGEPEDQNLSMIAREKLGNRFVNQVVPREEISDWFEAADVFVLASLNEGFGLVLLEAMRAGTPVVAHQRPHFESITGNTDSLVDMTTEGALQKWIASKEDSDLLALGAFGRERYESRFSWDAVKTDYLALLLDPVNALPRQGNSR